MSGTASEIVPVRLVRIPQYQYRLLGSYNGFTGLERARGWQLTRWAVLVGLIPRPSSCSICGAQSGRLQLHSESYYDPLRPFPICPRCHLTLHRRFNAPRPWLELTERHARAGAWFEQLSLHRIDLAQALRDNGGEKIADLMATLLCQLPSYIAPPTGRLVTNSDFE